MSAALALFWVLVMAKAALVVLRHVDGGTVSLAALPALAVEAFAFCALFGLLDAGLARVRASSRARTALFAAVSAYAAFNVPIARVMGTPLTASMVGATGGAISDSIFGYVTASNVLVVVFLLGFAAVAKRLADRGRPRARWTGLVASAAVAAFGLWQRGHTETLGLHRDPALTLVKTSLARTRLADAVADAHASGGDAMAPSGSALDLSHLAGSAKGRHVVWIILESTGARYLAPYGAARDPMPNLTKLTRESVVFDHAYAVYPESIKGLYSMLCSFAPAPNTTANEYASAKLPCDALPAVMSSAGYATSLFHSGRFAYLGMDSVVADRGYGEMKDALDLRGKHFSSFGTDDMTTAQAVLARFDARKPGERVFATYMPISGHHPYESPGEGPRPFGETNDEDRYASDLFRGDLALGALIDGLKERVLFEDTVFVIHGDHGEAFSQHEGNFAHSFFAYDENLHVPLVVAIPGVTTKTVHAPQPVSLLDVAPTIAALIGSTPAKGWQGRSVLDGTPRVVRSFADHGATLLALHDDKMKVLVDEETGRVRIYDLARDPREQTDVASAFPGLAAAGRTDLEAWAARERHLVRTSAGVPKL